MQKERRPTVTTPGPSRKDRIREWWKQQEAADRDRGPTPWEEAVAPLAGLKLDPKALLFASPNRVDVNLDALLRLLDLPKRKRERDGEADR